jgi:ABC-type sugar transport system ATPase subunit
VLKKSIHAFYGKNKKRFLSDAKGVCILENQNRSYLKTRDLRKSFGHINALDGVTIDVRLGEVLAIVGDNGAGKSTLIKMLSGVLRPDSGRMVLNGQSYERLTPRVAAKLGVSTVYQDLSLVDTMNTWENIFLGNEYRRIGFMDEARMREEAIGILERLEINIPDPDVAVRMLSGGQRQCVAVAKAIHQGGRLIIFDEPTAAMGVKETRAVQRLLVKLAKEGYGVLLISHNIRQVFETAQRICIMRHGKVLTVVDTHLVDYEKVVSMIINGMEMDAV